MSVIYMLHISTFCLNNLSNTFSWIFCSSLYTKFYRIYVKRSLTYTCKTMLTLENTIWILILSKLSLLHVLFLCITRQKSMSIVSFNCFGNGKNGRHLCIPILSWSLGMFQLYRILALSYSKPCLSFISCMYFKFYILRILILCMLSWIVVYLCMWWHTCRFQSTIYGSHYLFQPCMSRDKT